MPVSQTPCSLADRQPHVFVRLGQDGRDARRDELARCYFVNATDLRALQWSDGHEHGEFPWIKGASIWTIGVVALSLTGKRRERVDLLARAGRAVPFRPKSVPSGLTKNQTSCPDPKTRAQHNTRRSKTRSASLK